MMTKKNVLNNYMSGIYYEGNNICGFINSDTCSSDAYDVLTEVDSYDNKAVEDIDLKTTAFCVTLAMWSDFTYNHEKLNQLIKNEYEALNQEESSYSKAEKNVLYTCYRSDYQYMEFSSIF